MNAAATPPGEQAALLAKAVACYAQARQDQDACRCLEKLGDYPAAGHLHERAERWEPAARCFERAGLWSLAARCYRRARRAVEAARCHQAADEWLDAAWLLAHEARQYGQARALLARIAPTSRADQLASDLVRARCAALRQRARAGAWVRAAILAWPALDAGRERLLDWVLILAGVLDRPDLAAQMHATAHANGWPDAGAAWETWSLDRLDHMAGLDIEPQEESA